MLRLFLGLCHLIQVLQHCPPYEFATLMFYAHGINFAFTTFPTSNSSAPLKG